MIALMIWPSTEGGSSAWAIERITGKRSMTFPLVKNHKFVSVYSRFVKDHKRLFSICRVRALIIKKQGIGDSVAFPKYVENVNGLKVFYREAGDPKNPMMVLLHGFPSSSHMY